MFRHVLAKSSSHNQTSKEIHHIMIPRTNLKKLPRQIYNPRSSNSIIEQQRDLIREFLKINKMKLKTFIELYGPDLLSKINLINDTNGVKKTHVDTIPSVIKDLDEVITLQSQASKSILSSNEPNSQNFKDTFSYQADKSIINSDKKLVIESNTDLKE